MLQIFSKLKDTWFALPAPAEVEARAIESIERDHAIMRTDVLRARESAQINWRYLVEREMDETRRDLFAAEREFEASEAQVQMLRRRLAALTRHDTQVGGFPELHTS